MRFEARQAGVPIFLPPAVGELVEVEVDDDLVAEPGIPEWRQGDVTRCMADGRFQVRVHKPGGELDDEFKEWYNRHNEGSEWRRIPGAPRIEREKLKRKAPLLLTSSADIASTSYAKGKRTTPGRPAAAKAATAKTPSQPRPCAKGAGGNKKPKLLSGSVGSSNATYMASDLRGGSRASKLCAAKAPSTQQLVVHPTAGYGLGMDPVAEMLGRFKLDAYVEKFEEAGYDDLEYLMDMGDAQIECLIADCGLKSGHAAKFRDYLKVERARLGGGA